MTACRVDQDRVRGHRRLREARHHGVGPFQQANDVDSGDRRRQQRWRAENARRPIEFHLTVKSIGTPERSRQGCETAARPSERDKPFPDDASISEASPRQCLDDHLGPCDDGFVDRRCINGKNGPLIEQVAGTRTGFGGDQVKQSQKAIVVGIAVEPGEARPSSTFPPRQIVVKRMAARSHQQPRDRRKAPGRHDDEPIDRVADPACLTKDRKEAACGPLGAVLPEHRPRPIELSRVGCQLGLDGLGSSPELTRFPHTAVPSIHPMHERIFRRARPDHTHRGAFSYGLVQM